MHSFKCKMKSGTYGVCRLYAVRQGTNSSHVRWTTARHWLETVNCRGHPECCGHSERWVIQNAVIIQNSHNHAKIGTSDCPWPTNLWVGLLSHAYWTPAQSRPHHACVETLSVVYTSASNGSRIARKRFANQMHVCVDGTANLRCIVCKRFAYCSPRTKIWTQREMDAPSVLSMHQVSFARLRFAEN